MATSSIIPDPKEWTNWANRAILKPVKDEVQKVADAVSRVPDAVKQAIDEPIASSLSRIRIARLAELLNTPHAILRAQVQRRLALDDLRVRRTIVAVRDAGLPALTRMLDDYLERLVAVEHAVTALLGRRFPVVEAIAADLRRLLGAAGDTQAGGKADDERTAVLVLFDAVTETFHALLSDLGITAGGGGKPGPLPGLPPGHFHRWICCTTAIDQPAPDIDRKAQQRLRLAMLKVMLSYVDNVDLHPARFIEGCRAAVGDKSFGGTSLGGFPLTSARPGAALHNGSAFMQAYTGLLAAAFEHVFASSRATDTAGPRAAVGLFHALPMSLRMQRPDLCRLDLERSASSANSAIRDVELELHCEFTAMKTATTLASLSAATVRTAINGLGNGIWEISPNNPPLVDTIASLIAIPIYELEKALIYDLLRRLRVYVSDKPIPVDDHLVIARATFDVPDFASATDTEKTLSAVVAVASDDGALIDAVRQLFGGLPIDLDKLPVDDRGTGLAPILRGLLEDAVAAAFVVSA